MLLRRPRSTLFPYTTLFRSFTTGRGSVYGCKPAPCIKVATNTPLYTHMGDDMDINAGTILDGTETVEQVGMRIFEKIVDRKSTRLNSSHITISYAVFCLKKK